MLKITRSGDPPITPAAPPYTSIHLPLFHMQDEYGEYTWRSAA